VRIALVAILAAATALVAASMLGVASAEAPTSGTPTRSVGVEGIGSAGIPQEADAAAANNAYRQAMAAALSDGQDKASFLAAKAGATLGSVLTVTEDGGYVNCTGPESSYVEYQGAQPDIGYARNQVAPAAAAPSVRSAPGVPRKSSSHKHKKKRAKKAAAASCTVSAQLSLSYQIG
jgi:hypothetical protein